MTDETDTGERRPTSVGDHVRFVLWDRMRTGTVVRAGTVQRRRRGKFRAGQSEFINVQLDDDEWTTVVALCADQDDWQAVS